MKRFTLPRNVRFMVRVDGFNVFNQDNYGVPINNMNDSGFGTNTNVWGRRIFQLGGKFTF
jgi:hypothetical protein